MRTVHTASWFFCLLWLLSLTACLDAGRVVVFGEVDWNETLKPALTRIHSDDVPVTFHSDGGQFGEEIAAEVDWSSLRRSDGVYGFLPASRCLWVDDTGFPIFTWDALLADLRVLDDDGSPLTLSTDRVSFAGGQASDPITREKLTAAEHEEDEELAVLPDSSLTVLLRGYTGLDTRSNPPPHPFAPCVRHDLSPKLADIGVEGCAASHRNSSLPFTGIRCEKHAITGDVTYELQADGVLEMQDLEIDDRVIRTPPHVMEPTLMKVPDLQGREIARPLEFVGIQMVNASCDELPEHLRRHCEEVEKYEQDGSLTSPRALWLWRWFTPSLDADGDPIPDVVDRPGTRWEENWGPEIRVTEVGVFRYLGDDRETGQPITETLAPRKIYLDRDQLAERDIDCEEDLTGDDPTACTRFFPDEAGLLVTPGYHVSALGRGRRGEERLPKIEWTVEFRVHPDASGFFPLPEVDPLDDLFIRFDLLGACSNCLVSYMHPPAKDLGEVRLSEQGSFGRVFRVVNSGTSTIWVDTLRLSGRSARDFVVRASGGRRLPARVLAGEALELDLVFKSDQYGIHSATVEAVVRSAGRSATLSAPVVATAVDAIPILEPDYLHMWDPACSESLVGYTTRRALLANAGHLDLELYSAAIEGPDASRFTMAREEGNQLYPVSHESIASGDLVIYRFFYLPAQLGAPAPERRARARFDTNGGEVTLELRGHACPQ